MAARRDEEAERVGRAEMLVAVEVVVTIEEVEVSSERSARSHPDTSAHVWRATQLLARTKSRSWGLGRAGRDGRRGWRRGRVYSGDRAEVDRGKGRPSPGTDEARE